MRTFRFKTDEAATDAQEQTVTCGLHLEPSEDIVEEQATDCACFTEDACQESQSTLDNEVIPGSNIALYYFSWVHRFFYYINYMV